MNPKHMCGEVGGCRRRLVDLRIRFGAILDSS